MNEVEFEKIKSSLVEGSITADEAKRIIFDTPKMSWQSKEWEVIREKFLKDSCEQCGSTDILTLQHTFHPRRWKEVISVTFRSYHKRLQEEIPSEKLVSQNEVFERFRKENRFQIKEACPMCGSTNLIKRKTVKPIFRCNKKGCDNVFDIPIIKELPEFIDDRELSDIKPTRWMKTYTQIEKQILYEKRVALIDTTYLEDVNKDACIAYIDDCLRYLSCEDTVTYCKKCAYLDDVKGWNLCPICNVHYKNKFYPSCYECSHGVKYNETDSVHHKIDMYLKENCNNQ